MQNGLIWVEIDSASVDLGSGPMQSIGPPANRAEKSGRPRVVRLARRKACLLTKAGFEPAPCDGSALLSFRLA